ncbi:hypothetical protein F164LOC_09035 [Pectobacterium carotovorum]|nr:hypothetical protein F164LOC_09035 [Pectobacterium carotovorum]
MAISDIYSKRQKRLREQPSDVYYYEKIPDKLKTQIIHIVNDSIGSCSTFTQRNGRYYTEDKSDEAYRIINKTLCREYGIFELEGYGDSYHGKIYNTLMRSDDHERCLDIIELSFQMINGPLREDYQFQRKGFMNPDEALIELNHRFRENSIGYQFEGDEIIRVDSQLIHNEVVKPVINLLNELREYDGANNEFLSAHEHYRHGRYKESLNDCLKSFESLMKAIHEKKGWSYGTGDSASKLINSCLTNQLVPSYLQSQFTSLKTMLETGIPTIRNKNSGHGQGSEVKPVDEELVSYMLHLTATNLLFIAKCAEK